MKSEGYIWIETCKGEWVKIGEKTLIELEFEKV